MRRQAIPGVLAVVLLALSGCGGDTTKAVHPQLVPPQAELDFGAVPVLNTKTLTVPLLNVGRATLKVEGVSVKEQSVPFTLGTLPTEVGASEELPLEVNFVPPLEQDFQATLVIRTDDPSNPEVEVALKGKGSTRAIMEVEPPSIDFGRVAEGTSAVKTFTINSKGTADLIVEELSFADGSSPAFEFIGSVKTPSTVPATDKNGLPGKIQLTVRYTVEEGAPDTASATVRIRGTDPDHRETTVAITGSVNRAPHAVIAPLGVGSPGMQVTLDGSMSNDPDNDLPLTYKWVLRNKPLGATTQIAADDQAVTTMVLDPELPGEYVVELNVTDAQGAKNLVAARASIVAAPAQKLMVEMFWDNTNTDLDLHFLNQPFAAVGEAPDDCFYQNMTPDWGLVGDSTDDPEMVHDALKGFGPEVVGYVDPIDATYRVVVEFKNLHGTTNDPRSKVTVRLYEFGVVKGEFTKTLDHVDQYWSVADIEWPSGKITQLEP